MLVGQLALLAAALFSGAAFYITAVSPRSNSPHGSAWTTGPC